MAASQTIKDFAKSLYLSRDSEGKRQYSLRDITNEIEREYSKKITHTTISRWSKDGDWDMLLQQIVQFAIAKNAHNEDFTAEEQIIEARANDLAEVYKYGVQLTQIGTSVIQNSFKNNPHKNITNRDALVAIRTGANIMVRLNDIAGGNDKENSPGIIMMPDNGRGEISEDTKEKTKEYLRQNGVLMYPKDCEQKIG